MLKHKAPLLDEELQAISGCWEGDNHEVSNFTFSLTVKPEDVAWYIYDTWDIIINVIHILI